jgi:hypothetical protein
MDPNVTAFEMSAPGLAKFAWLKTFSASTGAAGAPLRKAAHRLV